MSLQVWLPLNGDLKNKGVANANIGSITTAQGSFISGGKIGQGLKTGTSNSISTEYTPDCTRDLTLCGWFKFNKAEIAAVLESKTYSSIASNATGNLIGNSSYGGIGLCWNGNAMNTTKVFTTLGIFASIRGNSNLYTAGSINVDFDKWYHLMLIWDSTNKILNFYVNGAKYKTVNVTNAGTVRNYPININYSGIYGGNGPSANIPFVTNDIRIYNYCLSTQEIKEISKGLVLHYTLDNPYNASNLIENGFGQDGTAHWSGSGQSSTTEIPPNTTVKRSFTGYQSDYVKINPLNSYTISCYLKTISATSGTTYPSIMPYDIDKKFIATQNCIEGFSNTYRTTLAQPLKKGDTVIYATDLSAWTTADNYYNYVAIFGYKDSTGHLYPDMGYTQDSPAFAAKGSTKTNINKTNNTITLNAAYTGADRPAGTVICQATAGSTYNYPFGGIAISTLTDWVFKTATLTPNSSSRLRYSAYWKWFCYGGNVWHAGIKLTDNTWMLNTVYDCSGNGYNGTITGNLDINSNTPRNNKSIYFTSNSSYIKIDNLITSNFGNSYTFAWWGKIDNYSYMQWGFSNGIRLNGVFQGNLWNTGDSSSNPLYKPGTTTQVTAPSTNVWHHWVMTGDGTNCKVYLDGVYFGIAKTYKSISGTSIFINGWDTGTSYSSSNYQISDFRIYSTVLSAEDAKALYEISAKIDKNGNLFAYNYEEQ